MAVQNRNDIYISEYEKIEWVGFDALSCELVDVDYIIAKHDSFWKALEIFCVAACCGLNAFRFYSDDIKNAAHHTDKELLKSDLSILKSNLISSEKAVVISSNLNNLVDKKVFIQLLDHILSNL